MDGRGNVVATTGDGTIGTSASRAALNARVSGRTSLYSNHLADGSSDVALWSAIPDTNWTVHVAAPSRIFLTPWHRALLLMIGAAFISLALSIALARLRLLDLRNSQERAATDPRAKAWKLWDA